jgi:polysaccharide biosynthesis protein PslH
VKLYEHIYRPLKKRLPELELYIVGRAPPEQVKALAEEESVCVTGSVKSIWPFLNAVSVFVLPLDTGAGQQNKIIEIMHAGRPVIASRIANGGIGAVHGQHMLVCGENLDAWVEAAHDMLTNPEKAEALGRAGRQFAMDRYNWSEICPQFEILLGDVSVGPGLTGDIQLIDDGVLLPPAGEGD